MDEYGRVAVPSDAASVWMSEMELVELFNVIVPTLRATVRSVYKSGVLKSCEVETRIRLQWSLHLPSISTHPMPQGCAMPFWKGCACEKTDKCCGFR